MSHQEDTESRPKSGDSASQEHTYYLPESGGSEQQEFKTLNNSVVIIGANGSGKSRLGAWMENEHLDKIHRIGAQRSLTFGPNIQQKNLEQANNCLWFGTEDVAHDHVNRWGNTKIGENWVPSYTTALLNDYEHVLAVVNAKQHNEEHNYWKQCKECSDVESPLPLPPSTITDKIKAVWNQIFPQRQIDIEDSKVIAIMGSSKYEGKEMSDGERVALYLIAQALCVPENKTIIIDEPEIHLHRSIMNRLWLAIERLRPDCLFIYITHDTQFAANHKQSDKIWVKEYNGETWKWENITSIGFPEQLLLDTRGNRKPVIFVEGTYNSYDTKLYAAIYKGYDIIPCGGCFEVILRTKAFRRLRDEPPTLHYVEAYGIIDRDFRSEAEIIALKDDNIYTLKVAEVENLFIVEELLTFINTHHQKLEDNTGIEKVKNYVISERFCKQLDSQICKATIAEIKHRLSIIEISENDDGAETSLKSAFEKIDYSKIRSECGTPYRDAAEKKDYKEILKLFNCKDVSKNIGVCFGLSNNDYCDLVLRLINGEENTDIVNALSEYLPQNNEIPIKINLGEPK